LHIFPADFLYNPNRRTQSIRRLRYTITKRQIEREREKLQEKNENNTTITKKYAKQMNWG